VAESLSITTKGVTESSSACVVRNNWSHINNVDIQPSYSAMPLAIPSLRFVYREQPVITVVKAVATRLIGVRAATQISLHISTSSRFSSIVSLRIFFVTSSL
jgi:hypothetical protein